MKEEKKIMRSQSVSETIHEGGCARSVCAALIPTNYRDLISPHYKGSRWPLLMPLGDCLASSKTSPKLAAADGPGRLRTRTPRRGEELVWKVVRNAARRDSFLQESVARSSRAKERNASLAAGFVESVCVRARGSVCEPCVDNIPTPFLFIYIYIKRRTLRTGRGRRRQGRLARSLEKTSAIGLSHIRAA